MSFEEPSILEKLDAAVPAPLAQFDAFPKLPSTYRARSNSRGVLTLFVCLVTFTLMLNDIGEWLFGWPDHEFSVDGGTGSFMTINVDLVVAMPCSFISVDLRDAVGDHMFLSNARLGIRRDGVKFDVGQATMLKAHSEALSVRQAVAQSRKSRSLFSSLLQWDSTPYMPRYKHEPDAKGCRVSGQLDVKKVTGARYTNLFSLCTANLHITTLRHGYASHEHVDHKLMNLSHVITEFSFRPFFPDITQPLDNSFELTTERALFSFLVSFFFFLLSIDFLLSLLLSGPSALAFRRCSDRERGAGVVWLEVYPRASSDFAISAGKVRFSSVRVQGTFP
ncbi:endoplasmic reticulum-golgi intermediate compartment-domain-containing protein [Mycena alexandri]|uniref:Endoplasmic reticulum-golgi intermediate compartment-domain-containing protein n=1 Tax=Mycena alexandri TaxID=1745969 RepID=A0AAD6SH65_9AGAR|nr:endoplasmic reticulum-golgi intermediate compartment-domain-containing protein [Mycena alexandri]